MTQFESLSIKTTCPTCDGLGWINAENEPDTVALIPLSDKRLKPRRILLKISLVILFFVLAFLLIFFYWPRGVQIEFTENLIEPYSVHINYTDKCVHIMSQGKFYVYNSNWAEISLSPQIDGRVVIMTEKNPIQVHRLAATELRVSAREEKDVRFNMSFAIRDVADNINILLRCMTPFPLIHYIQMNIKFTMQYSYFSIWHFEHVYAYPLVNCYDALMFKEPPNLTDGSTARFEKHTMNQLRTPLML